MRAQPRMQPIKVEPSSDLNRPGEEIVLDHDYAGRIICGTLIVLPDVRADVVVSADKIYARGSVSGVLMGNEITVGPTGAVVGRVKGRLVRVAGRVNGLVHARTLGCSNGSRVEGEVIADRLERETGSIVVAHLAVGPDMSEDNDIVQAAEARMFRRPARRSVVDFVPAAAVAPAPAAVVESPRFDPVVVPIVTSPAPVEDIFQEEEVEAADDRVPFLIR